jgi:hypothetical protein
MTFFFGQAAYLTAGEAPNGDVLISWTAYPYHIWARRFDKLGQPLGDEMKLDQDDPTQARVSYVASDPASRFTVTWEENVNPGFIDDTTNRVFARRFSPLLMEFRVDAGPTGNFIQHPDVAASSGTLIFAWEDRRPDGMSGDGDIWANIIRNPPGMGCDPL